MTINPMAKHSQQPVDKVILVTALHVERVYLELVGDFVAELKASSHPKANKAQIMRDALRVYFFGEGARQLPLPKRPPT